MNIGKHKSLEPVTKRSVAWLEEQQEVSKVVLARTENCRHHYTAGHVRIAEDVPAGFKCTMYGGRGIVNIFVYFANNDREGLRKKIEKRWN